MGKKSIEQNFWEKVRKTKSCWLWIAARNKNGGYGVLSIGNGRLITAHRYSFKLAFGYLPQNGKQVLHRCPNKHCVKPDHLYEGTRQQNAYDAVLGGSKVAKLTPEAIKYIREIGRYLRRRYGIGGSSIGKVIDGDNWSWLK